MSIKTKLIETTKAKILVVGGLPEKLIDLKIVGKSIFFNDNFDVLTGEIYYKNHFKFLGKLSGIKEEQWKEIVPDPKQLFGSKFYKFIEGAKGFNLANSASESGLSLLKANDVLLENPIPEPDISVANDSWIEDYNKGWEKVFINPVIFIEKKN